MSSNLTLKFAPFGRWDCAKAQPLTSTLGQQMIFARIIGVVSTILLLLFALASPMLLISLVLIIANGGVLVAIVIGTFPVPIIYLQRAARNCIETKSYSKIYPMLIIFAIYTVLLFFAVIKAQRMH